MDQVQTFTGHVTRRRLLSGVLLGGGAALLAACQQPVAAPSSTAAPTAPPTAAPPTAAAPTTSAPTAPPAAKPTSAPAAAAATSASPAPAAPAPAANSQRWDALLSAAKGEGKVVVLGPPTPELRQSLPPAFKTRYGLTLEYTGEASGTFAPRLMTERAAGVYSADVVIAGANSMYEVIADRGKVTDTAMGMLAPLRPELLLPEVLDLTKYRDGKLWFMDPQDQYVFRVNNSTQNMITVNSSIVKPADIKSWSDLLKPEYQGKIAAYDPTIAGAGASSSAYLYEKIGADFIKRLFVDQNVFLTRDHRQTADLLARGTYPIGLYLQEQALSELIKQGLPATKVPVPPEAQETVTGGFGFIGLADRAPNPNAAKVFANWFLSKEGQQLWQDAQLQVSRRNDLDTSKYPEWFAGTTPDPKQQYFDAQGWDFTLNVQPRVSADIKRILTQR